MRNVLLIVMFILSCRASGTEQIADVLYIGETRYLISETPLDQWIAADKLAALLSPQLCSASWRGYKALWELRGGALWLMEIQKNPCADGYQRLEASLLFKGKDYPLQANWYNGKIILPVDEKRYVVRDKTDKNIASQEDNLGYQQEAFVFHFVEGKLNSKGVELIQVTY